MIRKIINIINGANAHWNDTNNIVFIHLWDESEKLNELYKIIARDYLLGSNYMSGRILGPSRDKYSDEKIKQKDINALTIDHFTDWYSTILITFYSLYNEKEGINSVNVFESLSVILDKKIEPILPNNDLNDNKRIENIVSKGTKEMMKKIGIIKLPDPFLYYAILQLMMATYIEMTKSINDKLEK